MSLGLADRQTDLLDDVTRFCDESLPEGSIYRLLHVEREGLFPDEMFADLFQDRGRRSVPPSVVATVMVLQRLEGLSDRDAVERFAFDARWRYAAGVGGYDGTGWDRFAHTVLVDFRARLARSADPRRIFNVTLDAAGKAGLVGARRVLDSTPLYDAVATMDTITLIRSAVRGLLRVAGPDLGAQLRVAMSSGDDYAGAGKPGIDWDDREAREELIDTRARDGYACLAVLDGRELAEPVAQAMQLLATVLGQDLETCEDGTLRIARRVAKDRIISTVDTETRHGHKTSNRGFDGYKGHLAVDPDSEIITDTEVTAGNVGDGAAAADLIDDLLQPTPTDGHAADGERPTVYGDNAYGTGELHDLLADNDINDRLKTQNPTAPRGRFPKDRFTIDLDADTVTCPNDVTVAIRRNKDGHGEASFADACAQCPLRAQCTDARNGRSIKVSRHEQRLATARAAQKNRNWRADYQATRPRVERKFGHLMRHRHGGRRARMRGRIKISADFNLLAAAHNLARLARLGLHNALGGWAVPTA